MSNQDYLFIENIPNQPPSISNSDMDTAIIYSPLQANSNTLVIEAVQLMNQVRDRCEITTKISPVNVTLPVSIERSSCILVIDNNQLVGIFTDRDLVKCTARGLNLQQATLKQVMKQVPVTLKKSQFTNIFVALNLFNQYKIHHLVIVDEQDHIVGIVTPQTLRQLMQVFDLLKMRSIQEVMTKNVIQCNLNTSILQISQLMANHNVSCVVITKPDTEPIGIVTERDILQIMSLELDILNLTAETIMSTPLSFIHPQQNVWQAHQKMQAKGIRRLVVLDDRNKLLGIVTQTNIINSVNPLEMYEMINVLQQQVNQLEAEKIQLFEQQNRQLNQRVQECDVQLSQNLNHEKILNILTQKIRNSLDVDSILQTTVSEVREHLQAERVIIYQLETLLSGQVVAESLSPEINSLLGQKVGDLCLVKKWIEHYRKGIVITINDIKLWDLEPQYVEDWLRLEIRATLIVPIVHHDQVWGFLSAHQCHQPRNWKTTEIKLLDKLSNNIAIAIQQSQLYQAVNKELQERQQVEREIKKLNQELEIRIAERTKTLEETNQQLLLEIAQRHQIHKKLQKQLKAIESTIDGIAIVQDNKFIYLNKSHIEIFGYDTAEDLIGKSWQELYEPKEIERFQQEVFPILMEKGFWRGEATARKSNGKLFDQEISLTLSEDGEIICVCRDITETKAAEAQLKKLILELSNFKYALDQSAIVAITDPQGTITYANDKFCQISQYSRAELIGSNHRIVNSGYHSLEFFQNLWSTITQGKVWHGEVKNRAKNGNYYWVDATIIPFLHENGKPWQYLAIRIDITDRKQAEQELFQALAREKELSELKSRFISMTSHEFRTPLAVIASSAGILKNFFHKLDDEKKVRHLDCIETYVQHTTRLLDDILLINKAESGKLAFEPMEVDIISFCQQLTEEIQLSTPHNQIIFASNITPGKTGKLDKKLLRQILINLLSNAVKYSPQNSTVRFELKVNEQNIIFVIEDQGIGIPQEDQAQLFESFHRAANVDNIPGTGLGLSIVAKCVDLHKGSVTLNSKLDQGTKVTVTIPY
jgi:PAS domain S-box-containing protein